MASNIDNTGTFHTTNMKPVADEETAALWAQNIADSLGYLLHAEKFVGNTNNYYQFNAEQYNAPADLGLGLILTKDAKHNTITGTVWNVYESANSTSSVTSTVTIEGTQVQTYTNSGVVLGHTGASSSFTWDAQYVSTGGTMQVNCHIARSQSAGDYYSLQQRMSAWSSI